MIRNMIFILITCFFVVSCSNRAKEHVGLLRVGPDENMIKTNKPLVIPDDMDIVPVRE